MTGDILAFVHPARLAACCRDEQTVWRLHEMAAHPRFAGRVGALVRARFGFAGVAGDPRFADEADAAIAALPLDDAPILTLRCGVVLWARAISREIRGPVIAAIADRLGGDALALARRHIDLGWDGPLPQDIDALEARILADGQACLGAWLDEQPAATRALLRYKWPTDNAVPANDDAGIKARGGGIVRHVAADMAVPA